MLIYFTIKECPGHNLQLLYQSERPIQIIFRAVYCFHVPGFFQVIMNSFDNEKIVKKINELLLSSSFT